MSNPAETYEREMVPVLFEPWAPLLLDLAAPQPGEHVLDAACGTGIVARRVAPRVGATGRVAGADLNPRMLEVARASAEREGIAVTWHECNACTLPFSDGEFDLVLCQQGLQFVPDRSLAVVEMRRVLKDGGRLTLALWRGLDHHPFLAALNSVIERHLGIPALAAPFSFGDADALHALLASGGFHDIVIEAHAMTARFPNPDRYIAMQVDVIAAAIPAAQHLDDAARADLTHAIEGDMTAMIRAVTRDDHMELPFHALLARAAG
jgi:SAM-dependent methyltransferase